MGSSSAANRYARAQFALGMAYLNDENARDQDREAAIAWIRAAADGPSALADAQTAMGELVDTEEEAVNYYKRAAAQAHVGAQTLLGIALSEGNGIERDYERAVDYFRKGSELGYAEAQYRLGLMYEAGVGVDDADAKVALCWFLRGECPSLSGLV